jgi:hypothetical protein
LESVAQIDRARCRESFERRFTVERMVQDYLKVYQRQVEGRNLLPGASLPASLEQPLMISESGAQPLMLSEGGIIGRN